ncbi:MAG: type II secretion system GspH family protein [Candidatus Accumulibacter sp.]|jgi:general secretion pathway protein G|nr:type II secretion system GspH family protein [Accumulibacter sp.]
MVSLIVNGEISPLKKRTRAEHFSACGFTLIEMLVVMAIVALLLSIAVPHYFSSLDRSKETVLKQNLKVMRDVIDKFYVDQGRYPETLNELVDKRYLRVLPLDPLTESEKTWVAILSKNPDIPGIADVRSGADGVSSEGEAFKEW